MARSTGGLLALALAWQIACVPAGAGSGGGGPGDGNANDNGSSNDNDSSAPETIRYEGVDTGGGAISLTVNTSTGEVTATLVGPDGASSGVGSAELDAAGLVSSLFITFTGSTGELLLYDGVASDDGSSLAGEFLVDAIPEGSWSADSVLTRGVP